jgi:hypothetical protein
VVVPLQGYVPPLPPGDSGGGAGGGAGGATGYGMQPWHEVSEEQSEWDKAWYTDLEILFATMVSLTIFLLLVLCFCC